MQLVRNEAYKLQTFFFTQHLKRHNIIRICQRRF